jgi:hypothetical protein
VHPDSEVASGADGYDAEDQHGRYGDYTDDNFHTADGSRAYSATVRGGLIRN